MCFKKKNEPVRLAKKPVKPPINWYVLGLFTIFIIICIIMIIMAWQSKNFTYYNGAINGTVI
jgi:hypothetical protein